MSGAELTMAQAVQATGGTLRGRGADGFCGVSIDSRALQPGQAFVAIAGERFDGHHYWRQAVERGANLLVVERELEGPIAETVRVLTVADTRQALGRLAQTWREMIGVQVVGITGSMGKTTTKELTRAVLERLGATHCNPGNFNNEIGLPLTLLAMPRDSRYAVLEMGMNTPGEIAYLTTLARPQVGLITCIAPVHLEGLGSLTAIAKAKGELLEGLGAEAWAIVPSQEPLLAPWLAGLPAARQIRFGWDQAADVRVTSARSLGPVGIAVELSLRGQVLDFSLPLVGEFQAINAAAAAAVGMVLGLAPEVIGAALASVTALKHRAAIRRIGPWQVLDDSYNANPVAVKAALETIVDLARGSEAVAVLGRMLELGPDAEHYHREVGRHAAGLGLSLLVTVDAGAIAQGAREAGMDRRAILELATSAEAARAVAERAAPGAWILVKASRGARLEAVIEQLGAPPPR